jgi:hypothetical protein
MEPQPMIVVDRYDTVEVARRTAASLVERGVGATVEPVSPDEPDATERWAVTVMPGDRSRARELLGLTDDDGDPDHEEQLASSVRGVLIPVLVGVVVLITVPLLAFLVSFKLSGG